MRDESYLQSLIRTLYLLSERGSGREETLRWDYEVRTACIFSFPSRQICNGAAKTGSLSYNSCTPSSLSTLQLQTTIWTWIRGFSNPKTPCSWWEHDSIWHQVPFGILKFPMGAGKEAKVKKDFQPCFAGQKAHGGSRIRTASSGNYIDTPWKFLDF